MRRNRKMPKKMSVVAGRSVQFGAVIVMVVAMAILNVLASSSCKQLAKVVREKVRQLEKLEDAQKRESARWDEMKTPERLEAALLALGMKMHYPKPEQVISMDGAGKPYPGQISVARASERNMAVQSAKYTPPASQVRRVAATRKRR